MTKLLFALGQLATDYKILVAENKYVVIYFLGGLVKSSWLTIPLREGNQSFCN